LLGLARVDPDLKLRRPVGPVRRLYRPHEADSRDNRICRPRKDDHRRISHELEDLAPMVLGRSEEHLVVAVEPRPHSTDAERAHGLRVVGDVRNEEGDRAPRQLCNLRLARELRYRGQWREPLLETECYDLVNALGPLEVFEQVLPEVAERNVRRLVLVDQARRGAREQDLAAVSDCAETRGPVEPMPKYPLSVSPGSAVWIPIRTLTCTPSGQAAPPWLCCIAIAAATASFARGNATKNASPCVSTSCPP
jgi:hypothetical protein